MCRASRGHRPGNRNIAGSSDLIRTLVDGRRSSGGVPPDEPDARPTSAALAAASARPARGWEKLHVDTVLGAEVGADLDFLVGASGGQVSRESH